MVMLLWPSRTIITGCDTFTTLFDTTSRLIDDDDADANATTTNTATVPSSRVPTKALQRFHCCFRTGRDLLLLLLLSDSGGLDTDTYYADCYCC